MLPAWLVAVVVASSGAALAWTALRGRVAGARLFAYTAACAPALGLGLASLQLFFAQLLGLGRPGLGAFQLMTLLLCSASLGGPWLRRRLGGRLTPEGRSSGLGQPAAGTNAAGLPSEPLLFRLAAWGAALASLALAIGSNWVIGRSWPGGTWDAAAIWNVKARFFFRAFEQMPHLLKLVDPTSHSNYPLLLPGAVAAQWSLAGGESPATGVLTGLLVLLGLGLLAAAVVADAGWPALGAVAAAVIWGNPMVLKWASSQVADVLVGYLFLGAVAFVASHLRGAVGQPLPPLLGGVFLGLLAWSKNEGALMAATLLGLAAVWLLAERAEWPILMARARRVILPLLAGAAPGFLALLLFKLLWSPETGLDTFLRGSPLERVLSLERWWIPLREIGKRLVPIGAAVGWSVVWPFLVAGGLLVAILLRRQRPPALLFWAAAILAVVGSWVPIYAVTPYGQLWHIENSIDRLYLQVFPAIATAVCLGLGLVLVRRPVAESADAVGGGSAAVTTRRMLVPPVAWVALLLAAGMAVKGYVVATWLPRIWLFLDELVYLTTAWDLGHWGAPGWPHPDFLFYPPLTSALVAPLLAIGIPPSLGYHLALVLLHVLLTSSVLAAWLTLQRLFGCGSRWLVAVLVLGPPAYTGLVLMSEPVLVACYSWYLYALVRLLLERRLRWALTAGALLAAAALTRSVGPLILAVTAGVALLDLLRDRDWKAARLMAVAVAIPVLTVVAWRYAGPTVRTIVSFQTPPQFWLALVVMFLPGSLLDTLRRVASEVGYVSLSSFGFALPVVLFVLAPRWSGGEGGRGSAEDPVVRSLVLHVLGFLAAMSGVAAVFMFAGGLADPLPRWDLYGRYVEFFALPLIAIAWGTLWVRRDQLSDRSRIGLAAAAVLLNTILLLAVPSSFWVDSLTLHQISPNSLGVAWLLGLIELFGAEARWLAVPLAGFLVWGLSARGRWRVATAFLVVGLSIANFTLAVRATSRQSFGSAVHGSLISDHLRAHPELLAAGLCIDYPKSDDPHAHYLYRAIADHLGKARVVVDPDEANCPMAVLTALELDRPVLASWPEAQYRIYAAASQPPAP